MPLPPNLVPFHEIPNFPILDEETLAQLQEVDDGGMELTKEMFAIFLADTPPRLSAIKTGVDSIDTKALREVAHALKGACGTIGAVRVQHISALLEAYGRGIDVESSPSELLTGLAEAFSEAQDAFKKYLG